MPAPTAISVSPTGGTTEVVAPIANSDPPAVISPAVVAALPAAISPYPTRSRRRRAEYAWAANSPVESAPPSTLNRAAQSPTPLSSRPPGAAAAVRSRTALYVSQIEPARLTASRQSGSGSSPPRAVRPNRDRCWSAAAACSGTARPRSPNCSAVCPPASSAVPRSSLHEEPAGPGAAAGRPPDARAGAAGSVSPSPSASPPACGTRTSLTAPDRPTPAPPPARRTSAAADALPSCAASASASESGCASWARASAVAAASGSLARPIRSSAASTWPGTPLRRAAAETGSSSGAGPAGGADEHQVAGLQRGRRDRPAHSPQVGGGGPPGQRRTGCGEGVVDQAAAVEAALGAALPAPDVGPSDLGGGRRHHGRAAGQAVQVDRPERARWLGRRELHPGARLRPHGVGAVHGDGDFDAAGQPVLGQLGERDQPAAVVAGGIIGGGAQVGHRRSRVTRQPLTGCQGGHVGRALGVRPGAVDAAHHADQEPGQHQQQHQRTGHHRDLATLAHRGTVAVTTAAAGSAGSRTGSGTVTTMRSPRRSILAAPRSDAGSGRPSATST